jgi:hypothetical protein
MHNDRMRLPARLLALPLVLTLALAGCSDDGEEAPGTGASGSPSSTESSAAAEPYLPVPEGVELTEQGSVLSVGDSATVAYEPRQGKVGALEVTVTSMEKASFDLFVGWEITPQIKKTAPYFVRARVTNVGDTDLGSKKGVEPVPLYAVDDQNRLIESSIFSGSFKPCESGVFPEKFRNGDTIKACMVYLTPDKGDLNAVSFRPTQEFNPIIWEGKVVPAGQDEKKADKKDDDEKSGGKKDDDKKSNG